MVNLRPNKWQPLGYKLWNLPTDETSPSFEEVREADARLRRGKAANLSEKGAELIIA